MKEEKIKIIIRITLVVFLLVGVVMTYFLFKLDQEIQSLYEKKNSLDNAYVQFVPLNAYIESVNPWPGISDESLQNIYKLAYFYTHGNYPSTETLSSVTSRYSYTEEVKKLENVAYPAKNKVLDELKEKQKEQTISFLSLIISQIITGFSGIALGITKKSYLEL